MKKLYLILIIVIVGLLLGIKTSCIEYDIIEGERIDENNCIVTIIPLIDEEEIEEPEEVLQPIEPMRELISNEWTSLGICRITTYCPCESCCGDYALTRPLDENGSPIVYTASGALAISGITVAVDPRIIPYGTEVMIDGHVYIAQDCGGGVKGTHIDIYCDDHDTALSFKWNSQEVFVRRKDI